MSDLIKRAIDSAKARKYWLNDSKNRNLSENHQKKVENQIELQRVTVEALAKQIAKKPEYEADGYVDGALCYDYAKCPICGHDFEYGIYDWECNYCSDCGQKLDWGEE